MSLPKKLLYVSIEFSKETTQLLAEKIHKYFENNNISNTYKTVYNSDCHITLCFFSDFKKDEFTKFVLQYDELFEKEVEVEISQLAFDEHCVAFTGIALDKSKNIKYYPEDKNLHITMMLNDKKPVYSNTLIQEHKKTNKLVDMKPFKITGTLTKVFSK